MPQVERGGIALSDSGSLVTASKLKSGEEARNPFTMQ